MEQHKRPGRPATRTGEYQRKTVEIRVDLIEFLNSLPQSWRASVEEALLLLREQEESEMEQVWFSLDGTEVVQGKFVRHKGDVLVVECDGKKMDVRYEDIIRMPWQHKTPYSEQAIAENRGCQIVYHGGEWSNATYTVKQGEEIILDNVSLVELQDWCWPEQA